ncbi:arginase family protein [Phycicoccus sp. BSK3Z-2]|uniref:Arginase family protein n=1 Tax=Phycicoccus avicenniae TaxID=2828860 RepID=A0A941HY28_9MICO|nr:arginase family protein [Phycicoccus avicenniae]MBR7742493.1 arginase family protein [Phycicoccus avicenniae]
MPDSVTLIHHAGRAGDYNDLAMVGSGQLAAALGDRLGVRPEVVGWPEPALSTGWAEELAAARPTLEATAHALDTALVAGRTPVLASSRCAVALATLPVLARHRPDAVVVWFDAHADLNTPDDTTTGYLGGLAFSGPLGLWDSGLGAGLASRNAVLVGARDVDPPERARIEDDIVTLVEVGPGTAEDLGRVVAGRPVFVHVDCDVLEPGTVPTDYRVPGGMTLEDLRRCAAVLAGGEVVGIEVGELESAPDDADPPGYVTALIEALEPLLAAVMQ